MEYVAGPSLASVLAQYPDGMPLGEVRAWLKGLVEGVAYLHDHGIVHRDLKPANLFMEEGIVKIGDYGLAKLITPSQGSEHSESIGTCHYMAPEISTRASTQADRHLRHRRDPLRDAHRPGAVRGGDRRRGPDEAPDGPARPLDAARAVSGRSSARPWPRTRTSARAGCYDLLPPEDAPKAPRRPVHRRGEGRSARAGTTAAAQGVAGRRGDPADRAPRSRSSTSAPRPGRRVRRGDRRSGPG